MDKTEFIANLTSELQRHFPEGLTPETQEALKNVIDGVEDLPPEVSLAQDSVGTAVAGILSFKGSEAVSEDSVSVSPEDETIQLLIKVEAYVERLRELVLSEYDRKDGKEVRLPYSVKIALNERIKGLKEGAEAGRLKSIDDTLSEKSLREDVIYISALDPTWPGRPSEMYLGLLPVKPIPLSPTQRRYGKRGPGVLSDDLSSDGRWS